MSLYPIYIDSSVAGAQLSIGTTNTSCIVIGPLNQSDTSNVSTVINGVRIDSYKTNNNLLVSFDNTSYKVTQSGSVGNFCNTAVSNWAFKVNPMTGTHCTAVGHNTLTYNSTGSHNTAIGADALANIATGSFNTALGNRALLSASSNSSNVAVGYNALTSSITAFYPNVAVGTNALQNFNNSIGGGNTAIGHNALAGLTTGTGNLALGYIADNLAGSGSINTTGNDNTILGNSATSSGFSNTIVIGKGAIANANNQIIIGAAGGDHTAWIQGSGGLNVPIGPTSLQGLTAETTSLGITTATKFKSNEYDINSTTSELLIGHSVIGGTSAIIRIGESMTNGVIAIGNGNGQNGTITIGGSGDSARIITIGSSGTGIAESLAGDSPINLNGKVKLIRPLTLPTTYVAPTAFTMLGGSSNNSFNVSIGASPANGTYVMSSILIPNAGTYLFTFLIQITYTIAYGYFYSNIAQTDTLQTVGTAIGTTHTVLVSTNWGQQPLGNVDSLFMTSNGSLVHTTTANKYYNLILYLSGGGTNGTPNGRFQITRLA